MPESVHVGFALVKVALGQVFLRVLPFPLSIIRPWLSILIHHLEDEQWTHWWPQFRDVVSLHQHKYVHVTTCIVNFHLLGDV
jgi:hypothetical protein